MKSLRITFYFVLADRMCTVNGDTVSPGVFRPIESLVSKSIQFFRAGGILRIGGDTERDSDREREPAVQDKGVVADGPPDFLCGFRCLLFLRPGQKDREFFSAIPRKDGAFREGDPLQALRQFPGALHLLPDGHTSHLRL